MAHDTMESAPQNVSARDEGFTLVEVIWALFLLGIIAMAALGLFINGMKSVAHVQRQQAAVALANSAMDAARSVPGGPVNAAGTSGMVKGRAEDAVKAAWDAAKDAEPSDTSDMTWVWDTEGGLDSDDEWVPIQTTAKVDSQTYTIDTLVGKCYRPKAASTTSQDCVANDPGGDTHVQMYRVRVVVNWDESSDGSAAHSYRLSTLIDPSDDPTWNTELPPFAYDDEANVEAGIKTFIGIVSNDTVEYTVNPVDELKQPSYGSVAKSALNGVMFTAPSDKSGTVTFTYKVRGSNGQQSDLPGTVTVHILPVPKDDKIYVVPGSTTVLNTEMLGNDIAVTNLSADRHTTVVPVWDPAVDMFSTEGVTSAIEDARAVDAQNLEDHGIHVSGGGTVTFDAPSAAGVDTVFYYHLVDDGSDAARFPSLSVGKVTVSTQDPPMTPKDIDKDKYDVTKDATLVPHEIDWRTETSSHSSIKIKVTKVEGPETTTALNNSHVWIDGAEYESTTNSTGDKLEFLGNNVMGTYVVTYKLEAASGALSAEKKITVQVVPVVAPPSVTVTSASTASTQTFTIPTTAFTPATGVKLTGLKITTTSTCNTLSQPSGLEVRVTFQGNASSPSRQKSCTITYSLQSTGTAPHDVISQTTSTLIVKRG